MSMHARLQTLAATLAAARTTGRGLGTLPVEALPVDEAEATEVQHALLAQLGQPVAGWKVGAKSADGPITAAPLPADSVLRSPAMLPLRQGRVPAGRLLGLELELAFFFDRDFGPADASLPDAELLSTIAHMAATFELVASRFDDGVAVPPLLAQADLLFHGGLVVGEPVPFDRGRSLTEPALRLVIDGRDVAGLPGHNPAGHPLRLLPWLVRHVVRGGGHLPAGTVVTTGSFVGLQPLPARGADVLGEIAGLPPVRLSLTG